MTNLRPIDELVNHIDFVFYYVFIYVIILQSVYRRLIPCLSSADFPTREEEEIKLKKVTLAALLPESPNPFVCEKRNTPPIKAQRYEINFKHTSFYYVKSQEIGIFVEKSSK